MNGNSSPIWPGAQAFRYRPTLILKSDYAVGIAVFVSFRDNTARINEFMHWIYKHGIHARIMASVDIFGKDASLFAMIMGIIAIVVVFVPAVVVLMGLFAFIIGLINFLKDKQDMMALIAMIVGLIVIIVAVLRLVDII